MINELLACCKQGQHTTAFDVAGFEHIFFLAEGLNSFNANNAA
jgi:hypothetical protein